jgi:hypothetical protein
MNGETARASMLDSQDLSIAVFGGRLLDAEEFEVFTVYGGEFLESIFEREGHRVLQDSLPSPSFQRQGEFVNKRCIRNRVSPTELGWKRKTEILEGPAVGDSGSRQPHRRLEMAGRTMRRGF